MSKAIDEILKDYAVRVLEVGAADSLSGPIIEEQILITKEAAQAIKEAIERARVQTQEVLSDPSDRRVAGLTTANLLKELGLDKAREGRKGDE